MFEILLLLIVQKKTQITVAYIDVNGLCLTTNTELKKKKSKSRANTETLKKK